MIQKISSMIPQSVTNHLIKGMWFVTLFMGKEFILIVDHGLKHI